MNENDLFIQSELALTHVIDQIKDNQWELPVSKEIHEEDWPLRKIINYHVYDTAWVPETLAGKTIAEVGTKYDGDLLGKDPKASWHTASDKAIAAVKDLSEADLDRTVHLSYGDFKAREYLWHISSFRTFRAVTIARFIGVDEALPEKLVKDLWQILPPNVEWLRQIGVFSTEVKVPENASLYDKLLGLAGYHPSKK